MARKRDKERSGRGRTKDSVGNTTRGGKQRQTQKVKERYGRDKDGEAIERIREADRETAKRDRDCNVKREGRHTLQMKGRLESNIKVWFRLMYSKK